VKTVCGYYDRGECRSCTSIAVDYSTQLREKETRLREALAFLELPELEATEASAQTGFRNRAKMVVTGTREEPVIGLAGEERLDAGRALLECPIHHPKLNAVIAGLPNYIREFNLLPYRIAERDGELKGLILFYSSETNELYLRFVLRSKECVSRIRKLLPKLQAEFPEIIVVSANIQPIPHAILEGPEEIFITERETIRHSIRGIPFRLAPQAFVQTNSVVASALYSTAAEWISEAKIERVAELYCGQGAFSFFAAKVAKTILGIDRNAEGVAAANRSAEEQGLSHLSFRSADAANVGSELEKFRPDLVLVNPPRKGLGNAVGILRDLRPKNLIYSSCSVESLRTDLLALGEGYRVKRFKLFDLFPHTSHFETLISLERIDPVLEQIDF
jgi:23S rRNA (uracil747-C5)-methyltransferase